MNTASLLIKRAIKSVAATAAIAGINRARPGSVNIFAYHRVVADIEKAERDAIYGIVISTDTFRRHCELLTLAYDVVSLEAATKFLKDGRKAARPLAVITFDDGYLDFYEQAFPVLRDLGLPATAFLPTACIGKSKPLAHDRIFWLLKLSLQKSVPLAAALLRAGVAGKLAAEIGSSRNLLQMTDLLVYMRNDLRERVIVELESEIGADLDSYPAEYQLLDWEMIREMSRHKIDFGSHTLNHVVLPLEDDSVGNEEIAASKAAIEQQTAANIVSFAYPNGEYTPRIRQHAARAGYAIAVTTENRINRFGADPLTLGRTSLCEESTRGLGGAYSPRVARLRLGI